MPDSLGDRMKGNYEDRNRVKLTRRMPVIMRLDGRAFHTFTRGLEKPFDPHFVEVMQYVTRCVFDEIQGAKIAYTQSDEISILITDFDNFDTAAWFDYNVQKMVSIAASVASVAFSMNWGKPVQFDARVFNIPKEEVINYFRWRYQDWTRNSIQMLARAHFSHKELDKKNVPAMHEMLHQKGVNWADLDPVYKNGTTFTKTERQESFNWKDETAMYCVEGLMEPDMELTEP